MKISKLTDLLGVSEATIKMYLCRPEFSHIEYERQRSHYIENVSDKDIMNLAKLVYKRRHNHAISMSR